MKTRVINLGFSLLLCLAFSSCNKEEFYEKEFLDTPTSGATNGSVEGGSQGGVDSGVDGGTTGSSTTGPSTGGVDGSTVGGTTGGVDGSTVGGTTGGVDGSTVGGTTGGVDGSTVGGTTGGVDGSTVGGTTGGVDGSTVGGTTGGVDGSTVGGTTGGVAQEETFHQAAQQTKNLDIVWIIDNSGSMADEQNDLGINFSAFIDDFITKNVNFKMGITTTDVSSANKKGKMVVGSDTNLTSAKAQENAAQFKLDFKNLIKVGTSGSGHEKGLEASEGFMQKHAASFIRPDAYLAVVIVSDEEDGSPKTVKAYTDYLKSFKASEGLVKVYSIADINHANSMPGVTPGGDRYIAASNQTSGVYANIQDDFYHVLTDMGESIINLLDSFALAHEPLAGSLKVFVNGVETSNYTYDSATHSIKFNAGSLPPVGAEIKVTYLK